MQTTHDEGLQECWRANVSRFAEYMRQLAIRQQQLDDEEDRFDGTALFTCSACDDSASRHVRDILATVFARDSGLGISHVDIVPQELLIFYSVVIGA